MLLRKWLQLAYLHCDWSWVNDYGGTIADGAVIGAGSIVTKDVGPYEIWAGNPAKFMRKRFDDGTIEKLLESERWDWSDEKLEEKGHSFIDVGEFLKQIEK